MAFVRVSGAEMKPALDSLCKIFATSVGPNGCLCLLMSSVDSLTLTSTSSRIIPNLSFDNPIFQFIQQCIGSQNKMYCNGGFYCGILLTKLLSHILESQVPQPLACCILNEFATIVRNGIINSALHIKVNLDSVHPFISVAQSILLSKCGLHKGEDTLSHCREQASLLVQAFLQSEASVGKVFVNVVGNSDKQYLHKGIVYQCTEEEHVVLNGKEWCNVSILLFSVMLTDQIDCKDIDTVNVVLPDKGKVQFELSQLFIEKAISLGIDVIACQKVVHPKLLLKLRRNGILVIQRLGKRMAEALEKTSGAIPISSLNMPLLECVLKMKGSLARVQCLEESNNNIVLLEGSLDCNICSLQLTTKSLQGDANLKIAAHQVLVALSQVLQDRAVCPGAGCSEVYLCTLLWRKIQSEREILCKKLVCSSTQLIYVMGWLEESLLQAAGLKCRNGNLAVDSVYNHAWKGSNSNASIVDTTTCNCGLISSRQVEQFKGSWNIVTLNHLRQWSSVVDVTVPALALTSTMIDTNSVIDVCSIKTSAINLAVDSCIAIANIGAIVLKRC